MVVNLVQANSGRATSGALSVTLGAAPTAGNLLVACWGWNGSASSFPVPAGWTLVKQWAGSSNLAAIWIKVAGPGESATLTVTPASGSNYDLHLAEFSGFVTPVVDKVAKADSGTVTVTTLASESTGALAGTGDLVVACVAIGTSASAPSWPVLTALRSTTRLLSGWMVDTDKSAKAPAPSWTGAGRASLVVGTIAPDVILGAFQGWGVPL